MGYDVKRTERYIIRALFAKKGSVGCFEGTDMLVASMPLRNSVGAKKQKSRFGNVLKRLRRDSTIKASQNAGSSSSSLQDLYWKVGLLSNDMAIFRSPW